MKVKLRLDLALAEEAFMLNDFRAVGYSTHEGWRDHDIIYKPAGIEGGRQDRNFYEKFFPEYWDRESFEAMHALTLHDDEFDKQDASITFHIISGKEASLGLVGVEKFYQRKKVATALVRMSVQIITALCDQDVVINTGFPERLEVPEAFQERIRELVKNLERST